jgi:hypothetical protein
MIRDPRLRLATALILAIVGLAIVGWSAATSQRAQDSGGAAPSPVVFVMGVLIMSVGVGLYQTRRNG